MINGNKVNNDNQGLLVLQRWLQAGHYLGNHTYSHLDLAKVDDKAYINDIQKSVCFVFLTQVSSYPKNLESIRAEFF